MSASEIQRVYGGRLGKTGDRLEFSPTRRLRAAGYLVLQWLGIMGWSVIADTALRGKPSFALLLVPFVGLTLMTWVTLGRPLRAALEWSRMPPPRRSLVIERREAGDFRHTSEFVVTLDGRAAPPTTRRGLFEVREGALVAYALVLGDRVLTVASFVSLYPGRENNRFDRRAASDAMRARETSRRPSPKSRQDSVLPLVRALIDTLELGSERLGSDARTPESNRRVVSSLVPKESTACAR